MRPERRALFLSLPLICTLAVAFAAVNARTAARVAAQTDAASQTDATPQASPAQEPRVFHVTVTDEQRDLIAGVN